MMITFSSKRKLVLKYFVYKYLQLIFEVCLITGKRIGLMKEGNIIHILLCNTSIVYYHSAKKVQRMSDFIRPNMVKF